jgi:hypothetical protein
MELIQKMKIRFGNQPFCNRFKFGGCRKRQNENTQSSKSIPLTVKTIFVLTIFGFFAIQKYNGFKTLYQKVPRYQPQIIQRFKLQQSRSIFGAIIHEL